MLRHVLPFVLMVLTLLIARQIYPYTSFMQPEVPDGFSIDVVATNLGGPTCLEWYDEDTLLVCDRDDGRILVLDEGMNRSTLISGLNKPHDIAITQNISLSAKLVIYYDMTTAILRILQTKLH